MKLLTFACLVRTSTDFEVRLAIRMIFDPIYWNPTPSTAYLYFVPLKKNFLGTEWVMQR